VRRAARAGILVSLATITVAGAVHAGSAGSHFACRELLGSKEHTHSPQLCGHRDGDLATFVVALTPDAELSEATFEAATFPDSCDVELALRPAGFARGCWPCDRKTQRLVLPISLAAASWALTPEPVTIRSAPKLPSLVGLQLNPRELWEALFGDLSYPPPVVGPDTLDDGEFDNEVAPELLHRTPVAWPTKARAAGLTGRVLLHVLVDRDGRVAVARVARSVPGLDEAAVECVRDWTFTPGRDGDKPRAMWVGVPITFGEGTK
jgi:TonB family protein